MKWFQGWGCVALAATMTEKQAAKTEKRIAKADKWAKRSLAVTNPVQSARNR